MEEIFINSENGQVGKYPIKLHIFSGRDRENSLLIIGFYLDFFSKNSEISYIKKVIEKELENRNLPVDECHFLISFDNVDISKSFKDKLFSFERTLTILSVFSFYLPKLDFKILSEMINKNKEEDIIKLIINFERLV